MSAAPVLQACLRLYYDRPRDPSAQSLDKHRPSLKNHVTNVENPPEGLLVLSLSAPGQATLPTLLFIVPLIAGTLVLERCLELCCPGWGELPVSRRSVWVTGIVTALLYTCIGYYFTTSVGAHSGDEGHYLVQAESLYRDHDLDIRNNLGNPPDSERQRYHVSPDSREGRWYSWHPFGLSLLLAPTVPLGVVARHAVLGAFSGLTLAGVAALCRMLGARLVWTALVLLLFGFSSLWGIYSSRALPEVAGAALATWLFVGLLAQPFRSRASALLVAGCALSLPWLHQRFAPASLVGGAWYLFGALKTSGQLRDRAVRIGLPALLFLVAGTAYALVQLGLFEGGSGYPVRRIITAVYPLGVWHTLGSNIGILATLPLFAWLLAAASLLIARDQEHRRYAIMALSMVLGMLLFCATRWYVIGASTPGRYLVLVAPLLLPCAAIALRTARPPARAWFLLLGLVSCAQFALMLLRLPRYGKSFVRTTDAMEVVYPVFQGLFHPLRDPAGSAWHPFALLLYFGTALLLFGLRPNRPSLQVGDTGSQPLKLPPGSG